MGTGYGGAVPFYTAPLRAIAQAEPGDVQAIAAAQIQLLSNFYQEVLSQAQKSLKWALVAAGVGLLFFLSAILALLVSQKTDVAVISAIGGGIVEFISALNFYLYGRTAAQMSRYQERLDRTQRFLLANSICESLDGEVKQTTRSRLVRVIAEISADDSGANTLVETSKAPGAS